MLLFSWWEVLGLVFYYTMVTISNTNFTSNLSLASILLLMPDCARELLSTSCSAYLELAEKGIKPPSAKDLRMMAAFQRYMGGE